MYITCTAASVQITNRTVCVLPSCQTLSEGEDESDTPVCQVPRTGVGGGGGVTEGDRVRKQPRSGMV
jgi:hypothetical protein